MGFGADCASQREGARKTLCYRFRPGSIFGEYLGHRSALKAPHSMGCRQLLVTRRRSYLRFSKRKGYGERPSTSDSGFASDQLPPKFRTTGIDIDSFAAFDYRLKPT